MMGSEAALGRWNAAGARIGLDGHAQRAAEGLEHRLGLMVGIVAAQRVDVQRHGRRD